MRAALLVVLLGTLAAAAFAAQVRHEMVDFEVYWTAGVRAAAGEPLYRAADEHYQFKYFPTFAYAFIPLAALPIGVAKGIWFAVSLGCLAVFLALSLRHLPRRVVPAHLILIGTLVTLGKFYAHELTLGQANLLFGVVVILALAQLQRHQETAAGAAFGAAAIIKPYAIVFLPYLVATRRVRAAAACGAAIAVALALPAVQYGIGGNLDLLQTWWTTVTSSASANLTNQDNVSIAALYAKWLGPGPMAQRLTIGTNVLLLGICGAIVALRRPRMRPEYLEVALLLTAIALLSPQGWDYVLLLSTPAVMLLVNALPQLSRPLQLATIVCLALSGLTIYDVMGRAAYAGFMAMSILTMVYGALIAVIVYVRARGLA